VKLQGEIIIPEAKLTHYLLVHRDQDDKSKFLAQVGFTQLNPNRLRESLLNLIQTEEAFRDKINKYGTFYLVEGELIGITGTLAVVTVWLKRTQDEKIQFITLKPKK
jgi:hypothetical protein